MSSTAGLRCALMRGGTSKGAFLLAEDLPADRTERDDLLLRLMGSPDPRQVDGLGGAHPLTSKVAVVSPSEVDGVDVDYLFLQVGVEEPVVSDSQTCGNLLAAVAPFAIHRGLVPAHDGTTAVVVRLVNTGTVARIEVRTPGGEVTYDGDAEITGVPGTAAPVLITSEPPRTPLLPTGESREVVAGVEVTCVDHGMPSVLVRAADLGVTGAESPAELEGRGDLVAAVAAIRAGAAARMGLLEDRRRPGESDAATLTRMSTPKVVLVLAPTHGGTIATRSFIPTRVHPAIGVLGAASVAAASVLPGTVAHEVAVPPTAGRPVRVEHPSGHLDIGVAATDDPDRPVGAASLVRTARLLLDGTAVPGPAYRGRTQPSTEPGAEPSTPPHAQPRTED